MSAPAPSVPPSAEHPAPAHLPEAFRRLHTMLDQAPGFVAVLRGPQHVYEFVNEAYQGLVGHRPVVGLPVATALPEVVAQGFIALLDEVYQNGVPYVGRSVPILLQRIKEGPMEEIFLDLIFHPIDDEGEAVSGIFVQGHEVTQQVRSERALRESEARYKTLFNSIDQGFCVIDLLFDAAGAPVDYRFVETNPAFEHQTGLTNAVGHTVMELVPTFEQRWVDAYAQVASTGESKRFIDHSPALGRWYDVFAFRVEDPEQRRVAVLFTDITAQRAAEESLRQSEANLNTIIDVLPVGISVVDGRGITTLSNSVALSVLGYASLGDIDQSAEGFVNRFEVCRPDGTEMPIEEWPYTRAFQGEAVSNFELLLRRRDTGAERRINLSSMPLETPGEPSARTVFVFQDITEARLAETAVRKSEELTRTIAENSTQGLAMMDARGYCTYANRAWLEMTGYTAEEISSKPLHDLVHHHYPDGRPFPMHECPIDRALPENFDLRAHEDLFFRKDGTPFPVMVAASPIFEYGVPVSTVIEIRDVSEARRSEEALRQSEERYRLIADAAFDAIWDWDVATNFITWNPAIAERFGWTEAPAGTPGKWWNERIHPDDHPRVAASIQQVIDGKIQRWEQAYRFLRADGTYADVLDRGRVLRDEQGKTARMIGAMVDFTDLREAERALRESEERARLALYVTGLGTWVWNANTGVVTYDEQAQKLVGLGEESMPQHLSEIGIRVHPDDLEHVRAAVRGARRPDAGRFDIEFRIVRADTGVRWLRSVATTLFEDGEDDPKPVRTVGTLFDITSHREAQAVLEQRVGERTAELAEANRQLQIRNRELQDFAYVASHDLQEPLRKIRTFSDLLELADDVDLGKEGAYLIERMRASAERMSALIRDLLAFSRVTTQEQGMQPVDLSETLDAVLSDLQVRLTETGGTVEAEGTLPVVTADAVQMHQLLLNLVGNALKFHREGVPPRVTVKGSVEPDGSATVTVEDNGIGFDPRFADRIFSPFQRLHARHRYEGTGMGLAIVRRIADRHGATIAVTSVPDKGSRFVVTLPATPPGP